MITDAQREALVILAEEAAEVQKAVAKILRFGFDSVYPAGAPTNRQKLIAEMGDFSAAVELVQLTCDFEYTEVGLATDKKLKDYASGEYLTMSPPGWLAWHK